LLIVGERAQHHLFMWSFGMLKLKEQKESCSKPNRFQNLPNVLLLLIFEHFEFCDFLATKKTNRFFNQLPMQAEEISFAKVWKNSKNTNHRDPVYKYRCQQQLRAKGVLDPNRFTFPTFRFHEFPISDLSFREQIFSSFKKWAPKALDFFDYSLNQDEFNYLVGSLPLLETLRIYADKIYDLSHLTRLVRLKDLCLYQTPLSLAQNRRFDFSVLSRLTTLRRLSCYFDEGFIEYIKQNFNNTKILPQNLEQLVLFTSPVLNMSEMVWCTLLNGLFCLNEIEFQGQLDHVSTLLERCPSIQILRSKYFTCRYSKKMNKEVYNNDECKQKLHKTTNVLLEIQMIMQKNYVQLLSTVCQKTLEILYFNGNCRSPVEVPLHQLFGFTNLTELSLLNAPPKMSNFDMYQLCTTFSKLKRLRLNVKFEQVEFKSNESKEEKKNQFFAPLVHLKNLTSLDLDYMNVKDLPTLPNLIFLRAFYACENINQILLACPKLESVITQINFNDELILETVCAIVSHPSLLSWKDDWASTMTEFSSFQEEICNGFNILHDMCKDRPNVLHFAPNWCHFPTTTDRGLSQLKCYQNDSNNLCICLQTSPYLSCRAHVDHNPCKNPPISSLSLKDNMDNDNELGNHNNSNNIISFTITLSVFIFSWFFAFDLHNSSLRNLK
jgi:hypothetical protein